MYDKIDKIGSKYHSLLTDYWVHHDLLSAQWWSIVIINLLFLTVLIVFIDRDRLLIISFAFMVNFVIVGVANEVGSFFDFWGYPHQFLIFTHRFNAVDFAVVPVILTFIYQFFSKWTVYLIASITVSAIMCFIGIPLFVLWNMYKLEHWNYFYSFLVTILMFIVAKVFVDFVGNRAKGYSS